jgi:branched-chain amino acid transport system ATP-binding protein
MTATVPTPDAAPGGEPLLRASGLTVSYGLVAAVNTIDIEIGPNEVVALLGANGAGKTSTLRALSGLVKSSGAITFNGTSISRKQADAIARLGLVHVPEGRRLFATLTAEENLLVGKTGVAGRDAVFQLDDVYDLFPPLRGMRKRRGWALSGGEQQMVAIGRGLLAAPRLLLLDEPSLGLAPIVVTAVYEALAQIRHRVALLLVEQNAHLALGLCDRAYVLAAGEVAMAGPASALADREQLLASYLAHNEPAAV